MTPSLTNTSLVKIGSFTSDIGAEISTYDSARQLLYVVSGDTTLQAINLSDPATPTLELAFDIAQFNVPLAGANSITTKNNLLAVAFGASVKTDPGVVAVVDLAAATAIAAVGGDVLAAVKIFTVGALPDMITFTPDGSKLLVANEGEAEVIENADGSLSVVDPEGSVSIIDVSGDFSSLGQKNVATADFSQFNSRKADLIGDGVRIFPDATVAEDVEPEYIAVSPDGTKAFVTLQENNAVAIVDIATATIEAIQPLGLKDYSKGAPQLTTYDFVNRGEINNGGAALMTADGQTIELGGFSGLFYEGVAANGNLKFITVPDRGPNGDPTGNQRPFLLPDYQARVVAFELNEATGEIVITDQLLLKRADGTPITGLPNIPNVDEIAVDAAGNPVDLANFGGLETFGADYDPFGADIESITRAPDGTFWMVDEYRPAIYHFDAEGTLIDRFVPQGTAAQATAANPGSPFTAGDFGTETLPADYLTRRSNRGFEGAALDSETGIFYAFIQTPLSNPNRAASDASSVIRMVGIDPATGIPVAEYVYILQKPEVGDTVDKIGDAVFAGDGKFYVIERDSDPSATGQRFVFEVDLKGATNVLGQSLGGQTLEQQTPDSLAALGIQPVGKTKVTSLASIGYSPTDKVEGIAVLPDGRLAVLNDNDFGVIAGLDAVQVGIIDFATSSGLDASDRDGGINIKPQPVFGLYMPDAITAFEADGETFYLIANEGDDRGDADEPGRGDAIRLKDIGQVTSLGRSGLSLDPALAQQLNANGLLADSELGRLTISSIDGDTDGDGDIDQIVAYGGRSFSVLDSKGNLVFDSGDQIERITAALAPELFNADESNAAAVDTRSDNKGPEPEAVTTGVIDGKLYAFIGLERAGGGVLVYDLANPRQPEFVQYVRSEGDIAPEGLTFIAAEDSPNAQPLLVVANEVSNTVAIYQASDLVPPATVFISEFHYDNDGTDTGEFVEITASAGTDLTGWQVVLYNGNGGAVYDTRSLSGVVVEQSDGLGTVVIDYPSNGIQNGSPDGIALVNPDGAVVEFLSYEGSFAAVGGPADGLVSTDIGAAESGSTAIGQSLQLIDGVWTGPSAATKGVVNGADGGNGGNPDTPIYSIQGEGHTSALAGTAVVTSGVVTAVDSNGFYLQDPAGDGNIATSDALFVFTGSAPTVAVGDALRVAGTVSEFTPGGVSTGNLSTTQISGSLTITMLSSGNALPAAVIVGAGGRVLPSVNIDDDAFGSFDPATDGIDFFESLEGMRVTAEDLLVVNGTNGFGEIFAVANRGASASGLSDRATLNISPSDFNPERIQINQDTGILPGFTLPSVDAGALIGNVTGVVGYSFGNFEILPTEAFAVVAPSTLTPEATALAGSNNQLTVASYNVLNLDINDADGDADVADGRLSAIAQQIISNLGNPDIIGLQEIQDNSGSADDGVTAANETLQALVEAIAAAGGPAYSFIDNTFIGNNVSGGQPGGNIRTAFLYNSARVSPVGSAQTIGNQSAGSPFNNGRLPLVATFLFNGEEVTVVNNHFSSKGGSAPILGTSQDFAARQEDTSVNGSLNERREQAQAVNNYVDGLLATDAAANVVVLGDLNEFEFVSPLQILEGTTTSTNGGQSTAAGGTPILTNLINSIPENERYSFIFPRQLARARPYFGLEQPCE